MQSAGALTWTPNRFDTSSGYRISRIVAPSRRGEPRQWLVLRPCSDRPRIQRRARHGFAPCSVSSNRTVNELSPNPARPVKSNVYRICPAIDNRLSALANPPILILPVAPRFGGIAAGRLGFAGGVWFGRRRWRRIQLANIGLIGRRTVGINCLAVGILPGINPCKRSQRKQSQNGKNENTHDILPFGFLVPIVWSARQAPRKDREFDRTT